MSDRLGMPLDEPVRMRCDDMQLVRALAIAKGRIEARRGDVWWNGGQARPVAEAKAAVGAVTDTDFPSQLMSPAADFLLRMRDRAILERLVGVRRVPMRTPVVLEGLVAAAARVGQGAAVPVLRGNFDTATLLPFKHAGIIVPTNEALRSGIALQAMLDTLAGAIAEGENASLLDTSNADSLLYAADSFAASGSSAVQVLSDLRDLCDAVPRGNTFVMCRGTATYYGTLQATNGTLLFPNVGPNGGSMLGLPVLVTRALEIDDSPVSRIVALLSPSDIVVADEGRVVFSLSQAAMIEQASDPTGDTIAPTAASKSYTSMFQAESTAIKAVREISWLARSGAAAYMTTTY